MSNGFDAGVIVGGGGLVGQTLALALDQAGVSVIVIDASKPADTLAASFDGRAFAIAFASYRMWRALGIGDVLDGVAQPIEEIMVTDGRLGAGARRGGPSLMHLHFDRSELNDDGEPLGLMCEARHVRAALDGAVRARSSIRMIQPMSVAAIERDAASAAVTLANGEKLRAPLLVGADGRRSFVRAAAGIRTIGWDYPVTAIVATIQHEKPHGGVAHEYFLPNGPFAILPLKGERSNIVWAEPRAAAEALLAMPEADFLAELRVAVWRFPWRLVAGRAAFWLSAVAAIGGADDRCAGVPGRRQRPWHSSAGRAGIESGA